MQRNLRNMSRNVETVFLSEYGKRGEKWAVGEISEAFSGGADRYVRILHNGREIFRSDDMHNPPVVIDTIPLPVRDSSVSPAFRRLAAAFYSSPINMKRLTANVSQ